jgi:hypothetical protein
LVHLAQVVLKENSSGEKCFCLSHGVSLAFGGFLLDGFLLDGGAT